MKKLSLLSKINLVVAIGVLAIFGLFAIIAFVSGTSSNYDVAGAFGIVSGLFLAGCAFLGGGYYFVLFLVGRSIENSNKITKGFNIVRIILLVLPLIVLFIISSIFKMNNNKRDYTFNDISITFPKEYIRLSENTTIGKYVEFSTEEKGNRCMIRFESVSDTDDLMKNFINTASRTDRLGDEIEYDVLKDLKQSDLVSREINGKEWKYYKNTYDNLKYYKYALIYKNNYYMLEIRNYDSTDNCNKDINTLFSTIEYK